MDLSKDMGMTYIYIYISDEKDDSLRVPKCTRQIKICPNPKPQKLLSAF